MVEGEIRAVLDEDNDFQGTYRKLLDSGTVRADLSASHAVDSLVKMR